MSFQSRNREAFDFNHFTVEIATPISIQFQSRNREAFDFNINYITPYVVASICDFNLVIERLLISTVDF